MIPNKILINKKKPKMSFLSLKPKDWCKGTERVSEEIDEILYEEK